MIWRIAVAVWLTLGIAVLGLSGQSRAQFNGCSYGFCTPSVVSTSYTGPLDVIPTAALAYSFRCTATAYAGNVADVVDTATGNTTGARLQCASGGTVSSLVSGSACTFVTGNACSSLGTTCAVACNVRTWYDQSGNGNDVTQVTLATQPPVTVSCFNSHPCAGTFANQQLSRATLASATVNQPLTISAVLQGTFGAIFGQFNGNLVVAITTNVLELNGGSGVFQTTAMTTASSHAVGVVVNGASSSFFVDSVSAAIGANVGTATINSTLITRIGQNSDGTLNYNGKLPEIIAWSGDKTLSMTALCHNQFVYWGTSTSC